MIRYKGWALKNKRNFLVWKENRFFYDPIKTIVFKTRGDAIHYIKNVNAVYGEVLPVRIEIEIKEIENGSTKLVD